MTTACLKATRRIPMSHTATKIMVIGVKAPQRLFLLRLMLLQMLQLHDLMRLPALAVLKLLLLVIVPE